MACRRRRRPVPVTLKRLAAPLSVFCFGIYKSLSKNPTGSEAPASTGAAYQAKCCPCQWAGPAGRGELGRGRGRKRGRPVPPRFGRTLATVLELRAIGERRRWRLGRAVL